jgi:hypothetical protein
MKNMVDVASKHEYKYKYKVLFEKDFYMDELKLVLELANKWSILTKLEFDLYLEKIEDGKIFRILSMLVYLGAPEDLQTMVINHFNMKTEDNEGSIDTKRFSNIIK